MIRTYNTVNLCISLLLGLVISSVAPAQVQDSSPWRRSYYGPLDQVPLPVVTANTNIVKDPEAMAELHNVVKMTTPLDWDGLKFMGTLLTGGAESSKRVPASLVMEQDTSFRLDIETSKGTTSIRADGPSSGVALPNGSHIGFPPSAQPKGKFLLPFQLWRTAVRSDVTVLNAGLVNIEGHQLQKITLIVPIVPIATLSDPVGTRDAIDIYIDNQAHRLVKTGRLLPATGHLLHRVFDIITYSDYRPVSTGYVPYSYSETTDGRQTLLFEAHEATVIQHQAKEGFTY